MQLVYVCARTNIVFPPDYVEEWGRKYGHGFGPVPVSEGLVNDYWLPVVGDGESAMHPLSVCRAQVDRIKMSEDEFAETAAILQIDDQKMITRSELMKLKQILKSAKMRQLFPEIAIDAAKQLETKLEVQKEKAFKMIKAF